MRIQRFPLYWRRCSGLKQVVLKFFGDAGLSRAELFQLKAYIWQWMLATWRRPGGWLERLVACRTKAQLRDYIQWLLDHGIDPF